MIENRNTFLKRLEHHFSTKDISLIEFAYDLAKEAHRTQKRDAGERYFEHPRALCIIAMDELDLYDRDLIVSLLFHDVGEDTPLLGNKTHSYKVFVTQAQFRLQKLFGKIVADTVIKLTKPVVDNVSFRAPEESFQYYIDEMKKSPDAVIGKAIDRLHNLRSLSSTNKQKIKRQIAETTAIYVPLFSSVTGKRKKYADILVRKINEQLSVLQTSL